MSPIKNYSEGINFWEVNQQYKVKSPFKELYLSDKSKGKRSSSDMMWFISFCYDKESIFYNQPVDEKHQVVGEDYCGDENYYSIHEDQLNLLIEAFLSDETQAQRSLRLWELRMHKRDVFLDNTEYSEDTYKMKEDMIKNSGAMYKELDRIKKDLAIEESGSGEGKGGSVSSVSDTGEI